MKVKGATAVYPKNVPDYAEAIADGGKVVVKVGQPVENRKGRTARLIDE